VVLGALDEGAAVEREDAGHGGLPLAGDLVVRVGLLNREAGGVHVPPHHDLPLPRRGLHLRLLQLHRERFRRRRRLPRTVHADGAVCEIREPVAHASHHLRSSAGFGRSKSRGRAEQVRGGARRASREYL
jgi:hypothetical protein